MKRGKKKREKGGNGGTQAVVKFTPKEEEDIKLMGAVNADEWVDVKKREFSAKMGRKVIPLETIIALRRKNLSTTQIGKILGCGPQNVRFRLRKAVQEVDLVSDYRKARADVLAVHQNRILSSINAKDMQKAGLKNKAIAFGVLYDKERLEQGKSTSNVAYADMVRARREKIKELEALGGSIDAEMAN